MEYSSNDISAYFQHCPECDIQWRSHTLKCCPNVARHVGATLVLDPFQIGVLMNAVETRSFGVNDETDLMHVLSEMMDDVWPDVPPALLAQACWMHIGTLVETQACASQTHPSSEEIEIAKEYFEERFQDSLQDYLDEYQRKE